MRILEIGTQSGDLTLILAHELGTKGTLLTMEADRKRAATARAKFAEAGLAERISVIVGEPLRFLHKVRGPFDVIVLHAAHDQPPIRQKLAGLLAPDGMLISAPTKYSEKDMTIAEWLAQAKADAEKRGLPELIPMLDGLAQATERLRAADWNDNPDTQTPFDSVDEPRADFAQGRPSDDDHQ